MQVRNLKRGTKGRTGRYSAGKIFQRGGRVQSKVLPQFSPSVAEICRHAVPRKSR